MLAWSLRGGSRLIVCVVYISKKDTKREKKKGVPTSRKENWTKLFVIARDGEKRKIHFCDVEIFWNEHHPISSDYYVLHTGCIRWNFAFYFGCVCAYARQNVFSKREKANRIENHCTHRKKEENKFFTSFVGWYWRQRPHLYADWERLASDTNQLLLLLLRRPISNAIRLIAVVVESDFCGYPQLQSKGLTFTTYRHTSYSYIRIASYKAMLTHESRIIRYRERRKKRLPPVVNNSWDIHRIRIFNGVAFQL